MREKKLLFHGLHDGVTSSDCCSQDNGSSFRTRVSLCCHWTRHFVSLSFLTPHWMPGFDREKEVRPPAPGKKKSPPEVSINQREVRGTEREKGRRRLGGLRDAQNDRPRPNYRSSRLGAQPRWLSLPSKVWRSVSSHSWDYFGHLVSLRPAVNTDVCIFSFFSFFLLFCFTALDGRSGFFAASSPRRVDLREMSERRRSAAALSSRAHAFSVEALIGSNKKRKLRGWEEKELELSMESLAADGEDPAHCLDMDPGQCADMHHTAQQSGYALCHCRPIQNDESRVRTWLHDPTHDRACSYKTSGFHVKLILNSVRDKPDTQVRDSQTCWSIFRHKKCFCRISSKN